MHRTVRILSRLQLILILEESQILTKIDSH
jgi:hypothetical protein